MPIWHIDHLKNPQGTVDLGLIRDEANELAPRRGPRQEVPPVGENLIDTVVHATSPTTYNTPVESILGSSTAPSSSRSASFPALIPLSRV